MSFESAKQISTNDPVRALTTFDHDVALAFERSGSVALFTSSGLTPGAPIASGPRALAVLGDRLIIANTSARSLTIAGRDLTITATIALAAAPLDLTAAGGVAWVLTGPLAADARVWRFESLLSEPTAIPGAEAIFASGDELALAITGEDAAAILRGGVLERFATCDEPRAVVLAPLDSTQKNALIVACGSGGLDVFRGPDRTHYEGGARLYDLIAADFDRDGAIDLAAVDLAGDAALVWRNDGNGAFEVVQTYNLDAGPIALDAVDLDQDGRLDLAISAFEARSLDVLMQRKED